MSEVKDYSEEKQDTHYNGVPSMYGRLVNEQNRMQPKYCEPGEAGGGMRGEKRNEQAGPQSMSTPKKKPEKNKGGRPTKFTPELADLICKRVATNSVGLKKMCEMYDDLPSKETINTWRWEKPEFSAQYAQAKLRQADLLAEECLEIADASELDTTVNAEGFEVCDIEYVNRCRLRIDTRKWLASKLLPKQYGPHVPKEDNKDDNKSVLEKIIAGELKIKYD